MNIEKAKFLWTTINKECQILVNKADHMTNTIPLEDKHRERQMPLGNVYKKGQLPLEKHEQGMCNPFQKR